MSKYAVIKVGSSQERVSVGDEFSVSSSFAEKTIIPVLVSPRKGQIVIDDKELKKYKVDLEYLTISKSKKLVFFNIKIKLETGEELDTEKTQELLKLKAYKDSKAPRRNNV